MTDLNELYRNEGWAIVTDLALDMDPKDVESQARNVAQWAFEQITKRDNLIADLVQHEGAEGFSDYTHEALLNCEPLK